MKIVAFEPDKREFEKLNSEGSTKYYNCLVHEKSQNLKMFLTRGSGKSSLYEPNISLVNRFYVPERFDVVDTKEFLSEQVCSLDDVFEKESMGDVDFIKLDTQGSELSILKGSKKVLSMCFGLHVEVGFAEIYRNQNFFREVDGFLSELGFQIIDLRRAYWKCRDFTNYYGKGQLVFGDALYFRSIDKIQEQLLNIEDVEFRKFKVYKCLLCCLVYEMFDYAICLLNLGLKNNIFTKDEYEEIEKITKEYSKKIRFPDFPGKHRVFNLLL